MKKFKLKKIKRISLLYAVALLSTGDRSMGIESVTQSSYTCNPSYNCYGLGQEVKKEAEELTIPLYLDSLEKSIF